MSLEANKLKKIIMFFLNISVISGFCFSNPQGTDPAEGFWLHINPTTGTVAAAWHFYQEGGKLHGKIVSLASPHPENKSKDSYPGFPVVGRVSQMPILGTPWIFGFSMERPGVWSGGNIILFNNGRIFKCKITFRPADGNKFMADTLEVRSEAGMGIGRSLFLQKTDQETAIRFLE
jgi:uncharacterized protein (DUF2147 family)